MARRRVNYYGSLSEYKESMVEGPPGSESQTWFPSYGFPGLPKPQFIGNMPEQLAAFDDNINKAGLPAIGGVGYTETINNPLEFRGIKDVYIKPEFIKEENYFRNDADSIYRKAANKSSRDSRITDHQNINDMYQGVVSGAAALSKYFRKPFRVLSSDKTILPTQANNKSLVLKIGDNIRPNRSIAGEGSVYIRPSRNGKPATTYQNLNVRVSDEIATFAPDMEPMNPKKWANTFMHEFGHNLGQAHPHEYTGGSKKNSILSYEAPDTNSKLLPADINYYRTTMGYNQTPQSIRQRIDSTGGILPNAPVVAPEQGLKYPSVLPAPIVKKKKNGNKK